jgi:hypothetical protein
MSILLIHCGRPNHLGVPFGCCAKILARLVGSPDKNAQSQQEFRVPMPQCGMGTARATPR